MSYLTDIRDIFNIIEPDGTFLFTSEARADDLSRNIAKENFPLFIIDDSPLQKTIRINQDASAIDYPKLKIYALTKYDILGNQIDENNSTRIEQHEKCIVKMTELALRVLGIYFRQGDGVIRQGTVSPTMETVDHYNIWSKMLYGVEVKVTNLQLLRMINYCTS
jgi:hypothetical protein